MFFTVDDAALNGLDLPNTMGWIDCKITNLKLSAFLLWTLSTFFSFFFSHFPTDHRSLLQRSRVILRVNTVHNTPLMNNQ